MTKKVAIIGGGVSGLSAIWIAANTMLPFSHGIAMATSVSASSRADCPSYNDTSSPLAQTSTPLREIMRNAHANVEVSIQILLHSKEFFLDKIRDFEELTGAVVTPIVSQAGTWYDDVRYDILSRDVGYIDAYASFGNWIPQFADMGGLMEITDEVGKAGLDWFDIMPAVRNGVAEYKGKTFAVPLDGDVILMLYRKDLVEDIGLPTPRTWDDVLEILEYYDNKDINGDGVPDYGNCFATAEDNIGGESFWAVAGSFLQTLGTSSGIFFDPDTMEPISSYRQEDFIKILQLYKKLVQHSPFRDDPSGVRWQENLAAFQAGRCVLWYNYLGPTRVIISKQAENNMTGVLNLAPLPGMKCSKDDYCPFSSKDGANHAPFLASGGFAYAINSRVSKEKQQAAVDFAFYLSDPAVSFRDVADPGSFLDPLRQRHTASLSNSETKEAQSFLDFGWEKRQLSMLQEVTEFNFLSENYVYDLRLLGAEEYRETGTMSHLIKHWNGELTAVSAADEMAKSWNVITDKYGLIQQRDAYRNILSLPVYVPPVPSISFGGSDAKAILLVAIPIAVILVILVAILIKQRHTIKYKTRDVETAPKGGQIALLFTDIQGSTSLWAHSKSAMSKALEVHHDIVRQCIDKYQAYEVKTIGDAFMIAIDSADRAVLLANEIQLNLVRADFPLELSSLPSCCVSYEKSHRDNMNESLKPMFKGLRVRIGIHLGTHSSTIEEGGQLQIMYDRVTKGYDYYGPVVNVAARIESIGFGGQTVISDAVYRELSDGSKVPSCISPIGELRLRGVSEAVFLHQVLPKDLKGRKFNGVYRRSSSVIDSTSSVMDFKILVNPEKHDSDKDVDVHSLTPVELQVTLKRMQERVLYLEHKLELLEKEDGDDSISFSSDISFEENIIAEKEASTHSASSAI